MQRPKREKNEKNKMRKEKDVIVKLMGSKISVQPYTKTFKKFSFEVCP